jgi:hypothetical protein
MEMTKTGTSNTVILSSFIKIHLPQHMELADLAQASGRDGWLVTGKAHINGERMSSSGTRILTGKFEFKTCAPLIPGTIDGTGLILPTRIQEWLHDRLEGHGTLTGHIKLRVVAARKSPTGYAWSGDWVESGLAPVEGEDEDISF